MNNNEKIMNKEDLLDLVSFVLSDKKMKNDPFLDTNDDSFRKLNDQVPAIYFLKKFQDGDVYAPLECGMVIDLYRDVFDEDEFNQYLKSYGVTKKDIQRIKSNINGRGSDGALTSICSDNKLAFLFAIEDWREALAEKAHRLGELMEEAHKVINFGEDQRSLYRGAGVYRLAINEGTAVASIYGGYYDAKPEKASYKEWVEAVDNVIAERFPKASVIKADGSGGEFFLRNEHDKDLFSAQSLSEYDVPSRRGYIHHNIQINNIPKVASIGVDEQKRITLSESKSVKKGRGI